MTSYETRHHRHDRIEMHRHQCAYVSLVLRGAYLERSVDGLFELSEGQLVFHPGFHAHENAFPDDGACVLNMALPQHPSAFPKGYRVVFVRDCDALADAFHRNPGEAIAIARTAMAGPSHEAVAGSDWVRSLARALERPRDAVPIGELASTLGVVPETASRYFRRVYGVGPAEFRREARLRSALAALTRGEALAEAALSAGYADQSHMGREFRRCLGQTPGDVQRSISFQKGAAETV